MINISTHPVWEKVNPLKKQGHLLRLKLARQYSRFLPQEKFVGIAGSVGKTTTSTLAEAVLKEKYTVLKTKPNLDPMFNLPITILHTRKRHDKILLEMGIEYPGEMEFYLSLIKPQTVIITRLSIEHSEFLGNIEKIIEEESQLVTQLSKEGCAILNYDDENARKLEAKTQAHVIFYGTDPTYCHVFASNVRFDKRGTIFELNYGSNRVEIQSKLLGEHQVYPMLAAAALGLQNDISLMKIKQALDKVEPPLHRMNLVEGMQEFTIIDDVYNSSPAAVEEGLKILEKMPGERKIAVLGDMLELGEFSQQEHRNLAPAIIKHKVDYVFLGQGDIAFTGEELIKQGYPSDRVSSNLPNQEIIKRLKEVVKKDDVLYLKASRGKHFEEILEQLT